MTTKDQWPSNRPSSRVKITLNTISTTPVISAIFLTAGQILILDKHHELSIISSAFFTVTHHRSITSENK